MSSVHPLCVAKTYVLARKVHTALSTAVKAELEKHEPMKQYLMEGIKPTIREAIEYLNELLKLNCFPSTSAKRMVEYARSELEKALEAKTPFEARVHLTWAETSLADVARALEHYIEYGKEVLA